MGLLEGKTALIFGLANERSIAWGISRAFHEQGARLGFSYAGEALERRVRPLAAQLGVDFVEECDVSRDEDIEAVAAKAREHFGEIDILVHSIGFANRVYQDIDILVHSIGFANRDELTGYFYNTSREGFHLAMDISVYSFVALARAFQPVMRKGGALLTLTYYGSVKVAPNYNIMGVAKAALEACTRYMANDFGPQGIRVNAISAGPIRTLAAAGVSGFKDMYRQFADMAPMRENVTIDDVGNAAVFLCSDMSAHVTGEIMYVDSGYNIMAAPDPKAKSEE